MRCKGWRPRNPSQHYLTPGNRIRGVPPRLPTTVTPRLGFPGSRSPFKKTYIWFKKGPFFGGEEYGLKGMHVLPWIPTLLPNILQVTTRLWPCLLFCLPNLAKVISIVEVQITPLQGGPREGANRGALISPACWILHIFFGFHWKLDLFFFFFFFLRQFALFLQGKANGFKKFTEI